VNGIQLDGQMSFYEDRLREADAYRLARLARGQRVRRPLSGRLSLMFKRGRATILCVLPHAQEPEYCRIPA
jgi:hypothetical protein